MGIHIGWPDLTVSRRRSLCDLIHELKAAIEDLDLLEHCLIAQGKKVPDGTIEYHSSRYEGIKELAELQFPEIRLSGRSDASPCLACTNGGLRRAMQRVTSSLANALGCYESELMHFYEHKTLIGSLAAKAKSNTSTPPAASRKRAGKARSTKTREIAK